MPNPKAISREALLPLFRGALDFAAEQTRRVLAEHPGYYPMYTVGGKWGKEPELWTHWCEGFYPGICWLLHKHTGDKEWYDAASRLSTKLEPRKHDRNVHDLGFLFFSTYLRWYRLTNEPALRDVLIEAGRTLALRRQKGGYLASFIGPQSLFIDIMMNVGIIFWAANATDDESLRQVAMEHCQATARYLVRPDGGTAHEGIFGVESGRFERESTHQGWKPESTWSRGLAWAVYGFTAAHRLSVAWKYADRRLYTEELDFLYLAQRCADYYFRRIPVGLVPYWDFDAPVERPPLWDSSAAAIMASGLWDLSEAMLQSAEQEWYRAAALSILQTLCSDKFLARSTPGWEGILLHGVYHKNKGIGVD
ncbi:glucuronyl hydrolase, partial [Planctomycetaceae bacterium SCGC AG-212-F19]